MEQKKSISSLELFSLKNKVIVVTGGTGILGGAFVEAIAEAGGSIVIIGRSKERGEKRAAEIKAGGTDCMFIAADVLNEEELIAAREKILNTYYKIDGLVNAAGGNIPQGIHQPDMDIFSINLDGMKKAMDLNLWGTLIPTQIFGAVMGKQGFGSIVNISSVNSKRAVTKVLGYNMGKAAVDCYTKWLAIELANRYGDKIRVNAIMPGFFLTEQNRALLTNEDGSLTARGASIISHSPFKRFGRPEELKGALIYLLSDASAFVTGMQVGVDGGFTEFSGV